MVQHPVAHLTSVHARNDNRIFNKMCRSLAVSGYPTHLIVADGLGDAEVDGVRISDVGRAGGGRLNRMLTRPRRLLERALASGASLYHLHDPELLTIAGALRRSGAKVVFDSHEDVPSTIVEKDYIPALVRRPLARLFSGYEQWHCRRLDAMVAATPHIRDKFTGCNSNSLDINNFPFLHEWPEPDPTIQKHDEVAFVGGINGIRGIAQIVDAIGRVDGVTLNLAGRFNDPAVEARVREAPGWSHVTELGFLDRPQVGKLLARSKAGLVTFLPVPNHVDAQPNKMFEYMSAGIPVIASHFPLWREIIEGNDCGICVDPQDPDAIAAAIRKIVGDPQRAEQMGINGRKAVVEKYNWASEETKLIGLYEKLLS